ncbi:MAG: TSUP family transporter [Hyphomicrobiaceae bacterium]
MLADLTLAEFALIAVTAFGAQIVGGLAGYGTGLLMPLVLVPMIGAPAVVPVIGLSAIITNATRVAAFRETLDIRKTLIVTLAALPFAALSAWGYTLLTGKGAAIFIGLMLIVLVPARRFFEHLKLTLSERGLAVSSVGYGLVMGGTSGSGVVLLSLLMATGLAGTQVIATDAAISFLLGFVKTGVFVGFGALDNKLVVIAVLIGLMATPGTLTAKWMVRRFSARVHTLILEAGIVIGGSLIIWRAVNG